jgi:dethiobiotin synthetase
MAKGFFITATDTGVGKTVVAAALIRLLKREGLSVCGMKPLETGCRREGGELVASKALRPTASPSLLPPGSPPRERGTR